MSEKDKQAILDAAEKLQQGIDQQLKNTEWDTHYDLELLIEIRKYFLKQNL